MKACNGETGSIENDNNNEIDGGVAELMRLIGDLPVEPILAAGLLTAAGAAVLAGIHELDLRRKELDRLDRDLACDRDCETCAGFLVDILAEDEALEDAITELRGLLATIRRRTTALGELAAPWMRDVLVTGDRLTTAMNLEVK